MPSDFENGAKKTIDLSVQTEKITSDILKNAMAEFLDGNAEKKGRMTIRQLQKKCHSKLESIEITENNIADFLQTARKYDVDFALKKDSSTTPPTYHVFFSASGNDRFDQAFSEYAGKMRDKLLERGEMHRDDLKQQAQTIARQPRKKEKERENDAIREELKNTYQLEIKVCNEKIESLTQQNKLLSSKLEANRINHQNKFTNTNVKDEIISKNNFRTKDDDEIEL